MKTILSILCAASAVAAANVPAWGQCGGNGYQGATTCTSGYSCVFVNEWYSQCQPGVDEPTATTTSSSTPTSTSVGGPESFRLLGRVDPSTRELVWPGTGVTFTFTGTSAAIAFDGVTGTNSVDIIVDDGEPVVVLDVNSGTASVSTPSGLAQGQHTVVLRKRSESYFGSITIGSISSDGTFNEPPAASTRQIEFIGDSITVGYGLDGTLPCTNSANLEDNPKTYAAVAANKLDADYHVIAWSGKGLTRNYVTTGEDTSPLMPELWTRVDATEAGSTYTFPSSWSPQAVVIALGTNDMSYLAFDSSGNSFSARPPLDAETFTSAMVSFVKTIKSHYINPDIFFLGSPMLSDSYPTAEDAQHSTLNSALKAAAAQIGAKAHFVDWPSQGSDVGCDYHPVASTNAVEGGVLAEAVGGVLGW